MTMPNICIYICEQQRVHKRSQRRMRLNLATRDIFRIFTVSGQISTVINKGYMSTMHSYTLLESIVYELQSKGAIVDPCVVDDLITCITTTKKVEYNKINLNK